MGKPMSIESNGKGFFSFAFIKPQNDGAMIRTAINEHPQFVFLYLI